jgi:hypothetical protein
MIAVVVEITGKLQNLRRAEFDAESTALATVPVNKDLATELARFWGRSALWHVNLEKLGDFANLNGTDSQFRGPAVKMKHFCVHFDRSHAQELMFFPTARRTSVCLG